MTSYIAMLKAEIAQTCLPEAPPKLTKRNPRPFLGANTAEKGTFVSFGGSPNRPVSPCEPPYVSVLTALRDRCPAHIEVADWRQAVEDGRRFLAQWGEQAEALGWTARDLFGLAPVPDKPAPNYRRLSRYDLTGLIWLLRGRPVVALTGATAAIQNPTGAITVYRKHYKPALGPVGDSLDDLDQWRRP